MDEVVASQLVAGEEALEIHTDRRDMKSALKDYQNSFSNRRSQDVVDNNSGSPLFTVVFQSAKAICHHIECPERPSILQSLTRNLEEALRPKSRGKGLGFPTPRIQGPK